ncbi:MAG: hypothetical protein AAFO29_08845, partial [Actinomycetota bacterium]
MQAQLVERSHADYLLSTDPTRLDLSAVHGFLQTTYWAADRTPEVQQRAIENSHLVIGAYTADGVQVGFARWSGAMNTSQSQAQVAR